MHSFFYKHVSHNIMTAQAEYGVEAWETDDGLLIVVGTHNLLAAGLGAFRYYTEVAWDLPAGLAEALAAGRWQWVNRGAREYQDERWPPGLVQDEPGTELLPMVSYYW